MKSLSESNYQQFLNKYGDTKSGTISVAQFIEACKQIKLDDSYSTQELAKFLIQLGDHRQ
jgi:Ca2+-binding EF-hand superfamily protein